MSGYILRAKDVNGNFLAYYIANESDRSKAESLVKEVSAAEGMDLVKNLDDKEIACWQSALKGHPRTESFDLAKGTCLDLAEWAHS